MASDSLYATAGRLWNASSTLNKTIKPDALDPTDKNAVIGVGAPWETSGTQNWKGAAATLNPRPNSNSIAPKRSPVCSEAGIDGSTFAMLVRLVCCVTP